MRGSFRQVAWDSGFQRRADASWEDNPIVVEVMKEKGIALPCNPGMVAEGVTKESNLVVTMGCSVEEVCPE